jgi:hypothetical protein
MSTPHRDHGGTPETPSSNHYSMAMQRSGPTDAAEDEGLEYVREALQAGGHGLAYTEPHAATHFVADTAPRGSEVTHSSSLTDVARTDQSNLSRDVPMQGKLIDQSSSIRTMTFQEIAAIIMPKNAKPRANLPATNPQRRPNAILARDEQSQRGLVDDRAIVYQLIHAGIIPDPAPHYLWDEVDSLVSWYKEELVVKLNSLLEEENRMRHRGKTLIRRMATNKPPGNQHEDLIKWCHTGGTGTYRRKINFYMYDDWIVRLERFDFMEDVQIIDMMVLISEVRHRLHSNPMTALRAPRPLATQQLQPILPKPPTIPRLGAQRQRRRSRLQYTVTRHRALHCNGCLNQTPLRSRVGGICLQSYISRRCLHSISSNTTRTMSIITIYHVLHLLRRTK